jgi:hypothetical protein
MTFWSYPERAAPAELVAAVQALPQWSEFHIAFVTRALFIWCEHTLSHSLTRSAQPASVIVDAIKQIRVSHGDNAVKAINPDELVRWQTIEQLLNYRILRATMNDPHSPERIIHIDEAHLFR